MGLCASSAATRLLEHVGDLGLGLAGAVRDLLTFLLDLGEEDLALALRAHVFAGAHRDDLGERGGDAGDEHRELLARRGRHRDDDDEDAGDTVLRAEDRLAHLAEQIGLTPFFAEVIGEPLPVVIRPLAHLRRGHGRRQITRPGPPLEATRGSPARVQAVTPPSRFSA